MARTVAEIYAEINSRPARSAWNKGVRDYAAELFDFYARESKGLADSDILTEKVTEADLLNGAQDWNEYSYGGSSLIYDADICKRLCTKRERERKHDGELSPGKGATWLGLQGLALMQASKIVLLVANRKE